MTRIRHFSNRKQIFGHLEWVFAARFIFASLWKYRISIILMLIYNDTELVLRILIIRPNVPVCLRYVPAAMKIAISISNSSRQTLMFYFYRFYNAVRCFVFFSFSLEISHRRMRSYGRCIWFLSFDSATSFQISVEPNYIDGKRFAATSSRWNSIGNFKHIVENFKQLQTIAFDFPRHRTLSVFESTVNQYRPKYRQSNVP